MRPLRPRDRQDKHFVLKAMVTCAALCLAVLHILKPALSIDAITVAFFLLAALPWLAPIIKTLELPGVGKVELRDLERAESQIASTQEQSTHTVRDSVRPTYLAIADTDANLALVGLRIELERRIRGLAVMHGAEARGALSGAIGRLASQGVLSQEQATGLKSMVRAGNRAAHGADVEPEVYRWAIEEGPRILALLDMKIAIGEGHDVDQWLKHAMTIIDFEGDEFRRICAVVLEMAIRDGKVTLPVVDDGPKERVREVLFKLNALEEIGDDVSPRWGIHYRATSLGHTLLSVLVSS